MSVRGGVGSRRDKCDRVPGEAAAGLEGQPLGEGEVRGMVWEGGEVGWHGNEAG